MMTKQGFKKIVPSKAVCQILVLAGACYLSGLFSISYFYHKHQSMDVVWVHFWDYWRGSWREFLLACTLSGALMGRTLLRPSKIHRLFLKSLLACLLVSFLTGLFFFFGVGLLSGLGTEGVNQSLDLLWYGVVQSGVGVAYCLPICLIGASVLTLILSKPKSNL